MVEGNFKNKQKHNHRFSFMDPLVLMVLAACAQPLGLWILKYALAEIDIKQLDMIGYCFLRWF